ncbi:MAG: proton-conducting transporter membrane subunit [Actinomycetota bacterium]
MTTAGAALLSAVAVAAGGDVALAVQGRAWLRVDAVAAVLAPVVGLVAATVLLYARRNLDGDQRAWRFAAGASVLLGATMVVVTAARLDVLVAGWVAGSAGTVWLCGYRGDPGGQAARRRAALALAAGDLALMVALAVLAGAGSDLRLEALTGEAAGSWGAVVALLLVVAALARAGQLPLPRWLPGTVAAPTPVSALLHAGAVNAGAVLLVRATPLLAPQRLAATALAIAAGATVVVGWVATKGRPDVKGTLAESTGVQMGFMLLAVAVGAPVAALTHLAGHALYKSVRFLGAGDAIARRLSARRWAPARAGLQVGPAMAGGAAAGAIAATWWSLAADVAAPERWLVGAALAAAAGHGTALLAAQPARVAGPIGVRASAAAAGTLALAWAAHRVLGGAVDHVDRSVPLAPLLGAMVAAATLIGAAMRHERLRLVLLARCAPAGGRIGQRPSEALVSRLSPARSEPAREAA